MEKLASRRKALDKYEKEKSMVSVRLEGNNAEKAEVLQRREEQQKEDVKTIERNIKKKEARVRRKLTEIEEQRNAEIEVRRER